MSGLPQVGGTFGRYRIDALLGRGAMGVVYLATDPTIDRRVALKVVAGELGESQDFLTRFEREAEVLAKLASPHVIDIYDYGTDDGRPYIATQYVGGGDLGALLHQRGPMPPSLSLRIVGQLAEALDDAHRAGVVHRDVKPTNVLLRDPDDPHMHAYLCDFGIARTATTSLTAPGTVAGTWGYLSPECGRGAPGSPASDIYALGCLLWATLNGAPPYVGSDVEVAVAHQKQPIPQLAGNDPVSRAVNQILQRSMAKRPEDRYASADEMRQALSAVGDPGDVPLTPLPPAPVHERTTVARDRRAPTAPPDASSSWTPPRRRRRGVWIAAACAAVVVIAGGITAAVAFSGDDDPDPSPKDPGTAEPAIRSDLDGDGLGDIALAVPHTKIENGQERVLSEMLIWHSDGTDFEPQYPLEFLEENDELLTLLLLGDFDGDRTSEILRMEVPNAAGPDGGTAGLRGTTSSGVDIDYTFDRMPGRDYWPYVADMNGDGKDDVVQQAVSPVAGQSFDVVDNLRREATVQVSFSNGEGFDEIATMYDFPGVTENLHFAFGDVDGDGDADLAVDQYDLDANQHSLTLYRSDGTALTPEEPQVIEDFSWFALTGMDTDGDTDDELVFVQSASDPTLGVIDFDPDAAEGEQWSGPRPTGPLPDFDEYFNALTTVTDVDGDGDDDLVLAIPRPQNTRLRLIVAEADQGSFTVRRSSLWDPESSPTDYYGLAYMVGQNQLP